MQNWFKILIGLVLTALLAGAVFANVRPRAPVAPPRADGALATAVFAGGCFWCTESDFDHMPGVTDVRSGYAGGRVNNPTYEQVSAGNTGHIESVLVTYDPRRISYEQLLARFIRTIDPTDAGGAFCDRGYQYRSAIFVANAAERAAALRALASAARQLRQPVATLILPRTRFWPAEAYHQDYASRNPIRYNFYRSRCGRDARLRAVWGE